MQICCNDETNRSSVLKRANRCFFDMKPPSASRTFRLSSGNMYFFSRSYKKIRIHCSKLDLHEYFNQSKVFCERLTSSSLNHMMASDVRTNQNSLFLNIPTLLRPSQPLRITWLPTFLFAWLSERCCALKRVTSL